MSANSEAQIIQAVSAENIISYLTEILRHDRWFTYPRHRLTADFAEEAFRKTCGLPRAGRFSLRADGHTRFGDCILPRAWDAREATCTIIGPGSAFRTVAQYTNEPTTLFRYSAPTPKQGLTAPVVLIEGGDDVEDYRGKNVRGKIVFTTSRPFFRLWRVAAAQGAIGLIGCWRKNAGVSWQNHIFVPDNPQRLFGFSISRVDALWLEQLLRAGNVRAQVNIDTRSYSGTLDTVWGDLPGTTQDEILVFAHLYEVGAMDNAAGCAMTMEIARVLQALIRKGALPKPRRRVRFMLGNEVHSLMDYLVNRVDDHSTISAGITLDHFGMTITARTPLSIVAAPAAGANFGDRLLERLARRHLVRHSGHPWLAYTVGNGGNDGLPADPCFGVPFPFFSQNVGISGSWHSSLDNLSLVDPDTLRHAAIIGAHYIQSVATAGTAEALRWQRETTDAARIALRNVVKKTAPDKITRAGLDHYIDEARERLVFERDRSVRELRSLGRLVDKKDQPKFEKALRATIQEVRQDATRVLDEVEKKCRRVYNPGRPLGILYQEPDASERAAATLVPTRTVPGILTFDTLPEHVQLNNPYGAPVYQAADLPLFWADGKRNLLDIFRLANQERNRRTLPQLVELFEFLEKFGYIGLQRKKVATVTRSMLRATLRKLGVVKGDVIIVHSSLRGLGYIPGGPVTVVRALQECVGPRGTVAMPVFSYSYPKWNRQPFDPKLSPAQTGTIPEFFRRLPGVRRSGHPTHSVAAWGQLAPELTRGHAQVPPFDRRGPFGILHEHNAKIIFLGCQMYANSMLHAVEDWLEVPYLTTEKAHFLQNGRTHFLTQDRMPGGHRDFYQQRDGHNAKIYQELYKRKLVREARVGNGMVWLLESRPLVDACTDIIRQDQRVLLCDDPKCRFCKQW
jgi:aminoglycoside 3-N-acetyltransferase